VASIHVSNWESRSARRRLLPPPSCLLREAPAPGVLHDERRACPKFHDRSHPGTVILGTEHGVLGTFHGCVCPPLRLAAPTALPTPPCVRQHQCRRLVVVAVDSSKLNARLGRLPRRVADHFTTAQLRRRGLVKGVCECGGGSPSYWSQRWDAATPPVRATSAALPPPPAAADSAKVACACQNLNCSLIIRILQTYRCGPERPF